MGFVEDQSVISSGECLGTTRSEIVAGNGDVCADRPSAEDGIDAAVLLLEFLEFASPIAAQRSRAKNKYPFQAVSVARCNRLRRFAEARFIGKQREVAPR